VIGFVNVTEEQLFQSTLPVRGGTQCQKRHRQPAEISIHPPRAGKDFNFPCLASTRSYFNPPSPCGEGHKKVPVQFPVTSISIHPPRAGRDDDLEILPKPNSISIHPPRAGRDGIIQQLAVHVIFQSPLPVRGGTQCHAGARLFPGYFNPPSPCGEGRHLPDPKHPSAVVFQSTLPVRGGTYQRLKLYSSGIFQSTLPVRGGTQSVNARVPRCTISIHPPRAGRDRKPLSIVKDESISIHPPRAGRDKTTVDVVDDGLYFNPPSPCGEGPETYTVSDNGVTISIHPPRAGRDVLCRVPSLPLAYFNPPSPCGEGLNYPLFGTAYDPFQSTLPVRGGTAWSRKRILPSHFNPPSPCGEGPESREPVHQSLEISIHPPRAGRDPKPAIKP